MNILKSLWPAPSGASISIPKHSEGDTEDDLDLKIKSLSYFFKRFDIERYPAFIPGTTDEYSLDIKANPASNNDRLDSVYNRQGFEKLILGNEHRILVDWVKNRFRGLLILSDLPSGVTAVDDLAPLGKKSLGYKFTVLNSQDDDDSYINVIVHESGIYHEHGLDIDNRIKILQDLIQQQRSLKPSFKKTFNKDDRAVIILRYVERLSEVVQIERIYKASLISKLENDLVLGSNVLKPNNDLTLNNIDEDEEDKNDNNRTLRKSRSPVRRYSNDPQSTSRPVLGTSPVKLSSIATLQPARITPTSTPSSSPSRATASIKTFQDLNHSSTSLSSLASNTSNSRPALRSRSSSPIKSVKKKQSMTLLKIDNSLQHHSRATPTTSDSKSIDRTDGLTQDEINLLKKQSENAVLSRLERERKLLSRS